MNREQIAGHWNEVKGKIKEKWGQLTDNDLTEANGNTDQLIGRIQQLYGGTKEEIERQLERL